MLDEFKDRGAVVLAVNAGDAADKIRGYFAENGFTMQPVCQKGDTISRQFGVAAYPTNYVIGPDGKVVYRGVAFAEAAMREAVESVTGKK
jgi:peroxiredoxin